MTANQEATFRVYENDGLSDADFVTTTITQRAVGWGVTPIPNRTATIRNSSNATVRVYENTV